MTASVSIAYYVGGVKLCLTQNHKHSQTKASTS